MLHRYGPEPAALKWTLLWPFRALKLGYTATHNLHGNSPLSFIFRNSDVKASCASSSSPPLFEFRDEFRSTDLLDEDAVVVVDRSKCLSITPEFVTLIIDSMSAKSLES